MGGKVRDLLPLLKLGGKEPLDRVATDRERFQADMAPPECLECGAFRTCQSPWLTGRGGLDSENLFLFDAPDEVADTHGVIVCGPTGELWERLAKQAGVDYPNHARYDNVVMCSPHGDPNMKTIRLCRTFWVKRITQMPNLKRVICMGKIALTSVLNEQVKGRLDTFRRQTLYVPEFPKLIFFVTYHPAAAKTNPALHNVIIEDIKYALETDGSEVNVDAEDEALIVEPVKNIHSSTSMWSILGESRDRPVLTLDFEHSGIVYENPMPWKRNGQVGELLLCAYDIHLPDVSGVTRLDIAPLPDRVIEVLANPNSYLIAFNVHHELAWLYITYGIWPAGRLFDPMIGFHLLDENYPDKSLEGILKKVFQTVPYKGEFWKTFNPSNINWSGLGNLCMQDVNNTRRLARWIAKCLLDQDLHRLFDHEMANRATSTYGTIRGVRYNLEEAVKQASALTEEAVKLETLLRGITNVPELNFASPDQLLPILQLFDPKITSTDATTLRKLLWRQPENLFASRLLALKRVQTQLRYLHNYEQQVFDDGLMHFDSHPMSRTGRHRASGPNLQNVMR